MNTKYTLFALIAGLGIGVAGTVSAANPSTYELLRDGTQRSEVIHLAAPGGSTGDRVSGFAMPPAGQAEAELARMEMSLAGSAYQRALRGLDAAEAHTHF